MRRTIMSAYDSPLGPMTLAAEDGEGLPVGGALIGVWFEGQRRDRAGLDEGAVIAEPGSDGEPAVLKRAREWLDRYFAGEEPAQPPALAARGTDFQQRVWAELFTIPYGSTRTYGQIADAVEAQTGHRCSARAVGGAVGCNPISIIVPCHRVVGADGSLTGYAAGTDRKTRLLRMEGVRLSDLGVDQDGLPGL